MYAVVNNTCTGRVETGNLGIQYLRIFFLLLEYKKLPQPSPQLWCSGTDFNIVSEQPSFKSHQTCIYKAN